MPYCAATPSPYTGITLVVFAVLVVAAVVVMYVAPRSRGPKDGD
jgi:hypothetical protein